MLARTRLVRQIREEIHRRILDGRLPPGSQLSPEVDLARSLGVSRNSLREALLALEQDGLLIRRHGHGTFVRNTQLLRYGLNTNLSATDLIRASGMRPGTADMRLAHDEATTHEADRMGMEVGTPVVVLERVRTADGKPVVHTRDVMPRRLFSEIGVDPDDLLREDLSLYRFMAERLGHSVVGGEAEIRPELASRELAARLAVPVDYPILVIEQLDSDEAEDRVLLTWEHWVAQSIGFAIHRRGPAIPVPRPFGLVARDVPVELPKGSRRTAARR